MNFYIELILKVCYFYEEVPTLDLHAIQSYLIELFFVKRKLILFLQHISFMVTSYNEYDR